MAVQASILLLTFNQEHFVEAAILSILNQNYPNLEIVISDDQSTDQTWNVIQRVISTHPQKNKIILNRNDVNLGVVGNYNQAYKLCSGEVIFTAAGDDISAPNRCSECIEFWLKNDKPDLVAADAFDMAIDGINLGVKKTDSLENWDLIKWIKKRPHFFGASHMITRRLFNINILDKNLPYEDQCLVFRAIMLGSAKRIPKPLVFHRQGGISQQLKFTKKKSKKDRLITGIANSIAELNQMLADMEILNNKNYRDIFLKKLDEHEFYLHILKSENKIKILIECIFKFNVRTSKKIRFLSYALTPSLMELIGGNK